MRTSMGLVAVGGKFTGTLGRRAPPDEAAGLRAEEELLARLHPAPEEDDVVVAARASRRRSRWAGGTRRSPRRCRGGFSGAGVVGPVECWKSSQDSADDAGRAPSDAEQLVGRGMRAIRLTFATRA